MSHRQLFVAADPSRAQRIDRAANESVDWAELVAGHAECPTCRAFVRLLTLRAGRSIVGELVAAYCTVCCTTTYFAPLA
jgi:hypothetical protein